MPRKRLPRDLARQMFEQASGHEALARELPWWRWRQRRRLREKAADLRKLADDFLRDVKPS